MQVKERWSNTLELENNKDENDNPTGGFVTGIGLDILWQNGPLGRGENKQQPNGAFVEDVLVACIYRLRFYQDSKYKCRENALVITHLEEALHWMQARHDERENRQVQGLHEV